MERSPTVTPEKTINQSSADETSDHDVAMELQETNSHQKTSEDEDE